MKPGIHMLAPAQIAVEYRPRGLIADFNLRVFDQRLSVAITMSRQVRASGVGDVGKTNWPKPKR